MINRIAATMVFLLLVAGGPLQAQTASNGETHDSIVNAAKTPQAHVEDNLNLDDSEAIIAPAKKTASQVTQADTAKNASSQSTALPVTPAAATTISAPDKNAAAASKTVSVADTVPLKPATAPQTVKDSANKAVDEDLILEGGVEELLDQAKVARKKAAEAKISAPASDSAHGAQLQPALPSSAVGLTKSSTPIPTPGTLTVPNSEAAPAAELSVPAPIEKVHSLNFANNLKEYRSPKLAMLMSLILPGSGQVYAQSNLWAAGFCIAEAALIVTGASFASRAAQKKVDAHKYAIKHYSDSTMKAYLDSNGTLHTYLKSLGIDSIFYPAIFPDSSNLTFLQQAGSGSGAYFSLINQGPSSPFIRGWDDVTPAVFTPTGFQLSTSDSIQYGIKSSSDPITADSSYLLYLKSDSTDLLYGQSAHQMVYNGMLQNSLAWSNRSRYAYLSLIINHLASSVMAGILAKRHNDELLGRESFWQHIGVDVCSVNTGSEIVPAYTLQVQF